LKGRRRLQVSQLLLRVLHVLKYRSISVLLVHQISSALLSNQVTAITTPRIGKTSVCTAVLVLTAAPDSHHAMLHQLAYTHRKKEVHRRLVVRLARINHKQDKSDVSTHQQGRMFQTLLQCHRLNVPMDTSMQMYAQLRGMPARQQLLVVT